jgi:copper resistance protein D
VTLLHVLSVWLHILAAAVWIGGAAFLAFVAVPAIRGRVSPEAYREVLEAVVLRFRAVAWTALGLLVATGLLQVFRYGFAAMFSGRIGRILTIKLVLVALALGLSAIHDFALGPRALAAMRDAPQADETERLRRAAGWIGRVTFLVSLAIVALAVMLFRPV